ncbi:MAG TPA: Uma2 family endonuclease [Isosphaeraceae bacterium]|jgi:Uma2 family endonuclease|nr:Uma2 family endonuclease [Isosphaeraceae bacterium]
MSTVQVRQQYTPDNLLTMPDGKHYELVDGQRVERGASALSSLVALEIGSLLRNHCKANNLAWVFGSDCGYRCFPGNKVRRADVSFVHRDRLPADRLGDGYIEIAPDLAVEVVSPHDLVYEVDQEVDDYLAAGVRLVWMVNPERRTVWVYRVDGPVRFLREPDELSGEDVLPGFRCLVSELFPPMPAAAQPAPVSPSSG